MLNVKMTQWGVGHGGFHTAEIRHTRDNGGTTRLYIYDCGSTARVGSLYPRIESYVRELQKNGMQQIDTLYLSHFDYDHVNGLKELSKKLAPGIRIDKIVAPFLTPEQQLATIASQSPSYSPLYVDLVLNPEETLERLFPGTEVELLAPTEVDELSDEVGMSTNSPGSMAIDSGAAEPGRFDVLWEIIPYVQPGVTAKAKEFWKELQKQGLATGKCLDTATIRDLVESHRPELRNLAIKFLGTDGSNLSSIVLYSAPGWGHEVKCFIRKSGNKISWGELPTNAARWLMRNPEEFGGWLSTGDARLETSCGVARLLRGLGMQRTQRVTVIAAPHHGSKNNSSAHLWQAFSNAKFVTAHTKKNSRHHPSLMVRKEVEKHQGKLYEVMGRSEERRVGKECPV